MRRLAVADSSSFARTTSSSRFSVRVPPISWKYDSSGRRSRLTETSSAGGGAAVGTILGGRLSRRAGAERGAAWRSSSFTRFLLRWLGPRRISWDCVLGRARSPKTPAPFRGGRGEKLPLCAGLDARASGLRGAAKTGHLAPSRFSFPAKSEVTHDGAPRGNHS